MMKDRQGLDATYLGGTFDRQVRIDDWDQKKVHEQAVLVLGVGGLGSILTINLLRLGVGKLFLLDYDVVDIHNLNRQLLFTAQDVGQSKVQSALKNSKFHNLGNTQIRIFHGNALTNWKTIVQLAQLSTFVYNCIDYGDKFDTAVSSLCIKLKLPLVMGGTFATSLTVDFFNPIAGQPCYLCLDDISRNYPSLSQIVPDKILQHEDISFLPKNTNPIGRSSVVVCTLCGQLMIAYFLNWLFLGQKPIKTQRLLFYHTTMEIMKFDQLQICKDCPFCGAINGQFLKAKLQEEKQKDQKQKKERQQLKEKAQNDIKEGTKDQTEVKQQEKLTIQQINKSQQTSKDAPNQVLIQNNDKTQINQVIIIQYKQNEQSYKINHSQ